MSHLDNHCNSVIIASNLANILTFFLGDTRIRGVVTTFTNVISSTMLSRLMLNIRDPKLVRTPLSTTVAEYPMISTFVDSPTRLGPAGPIRIDPGNNGGYSENAIEMIEMRDIR